MHASENDADSPLPQASSQTDLIELIRLALAGDKRAENELMVLCRKRFAPIAYGLKHLSKDDPDDLLQKACLKIWKELSSFNSEGDFWAWATVVGRREMFTMLKIRPKVYKDVRAVREAHDQIAAEKGGLPTIDEIAKKTGLTAGRVKNLLNRYALVFSESFDELAEEGLEPHDQSLLDPSKEVARAQDYCAMVTAMAQLNKRDREIIRLHYVEDLPLHSVTGPSVAQNLKIKPESVRTYHRRAIAKMKEIMERETA